MRIHLVTAESPASRRLRGSRLIQFPQLTMLLIAALTPKEHDVYHTGELVEPIRFDRPMPSMSAIPTWVRRSPRKLGRTLRPPCDGTSCGATADDA